jgi:hypothetical protein
MGRKTKGVKSRVIHTGRKNLKRKPVKKVIEKTAIETPISVMTVLKDEREEEQMEEDALAFKSVHHVADYEKRYAELKENGKTIFYFLHICHLHRYRHGKSSRGFLFCIKR